MEIIFLIILFFRSFGYHGDDGHLYQGTGRGTSFGPTFTTGDVRAYFSLTAQERFKSLTTFDHPHKTKRSLDVV